MMLNQIKSKFEDGCDLMELLKDKEDSEKERIFNAMMFMYKIRIDDEYGGEFGIKYNFYDDLRSCKWEQDKDGKDIGVLYGEVDVGVSERYGYYISRNWLEPLGKLKLDEYGNYDDDRLGEIDFVEVSDEAFEKYKEDILNGESMENEDNEIPF